VIPVEEDPQKRKISPAGRVCVIVVVGAVFAYNFRILASIDPFNIDVPAMEWKGKAAILIFTAFLGFIMLHQIWMLILNLRKGSGDTSSNKTLKGDK